MPRVSKSTGRSRKRFEDLRIGITGSPGTGKKSIAKALSNLTGLEPRYIGDVAVERHCGSWAKDGEFIVDTERLKGKIDTRGRITCGHLLPYVIPRKDIDFVAILRCSPQQLRKRYLRRGYSQSKIRENLEAELLDLVAQKSLEAYGRTKVSEYDTSRVRSPVLIARLILRTIDGEVPRRFGNVVNWTARASQSKIHLEALLEGKQGRQRVKQD